MQKKYNKIIITLILSLSLIVLVLFTLDYWNISNIANQPLTRDNYLELIQKYTEKKGNTDDSVKYLSYAIMYESFVPYMNLNSTDEDKNEKVHSNVFGRTINELVREGELLMKENNLNN